MKNILKIISLTIIIAFTIIIVRHYIVSANTIEIREPVYEEIDNINIGQEETKNNPGKIGIDSIVIKDKKYTTKHKTSNGEEYTIIGSIKIPKINLEYDILSSTSDELLKVSLNRYWGANPNQVGNMCIVGHNYLDSRFFGKLHRLNNGDYIQITDAYGVTLKYYVYDKFVADPYDTSCTSQLTNGEKEITLITCHNDGTERLVVKARANKEKINVINEIINIFNK